MSFAAMYGLKPADRIIERIFPTGLSKHHGIYLGMDNQGTEWISANIAFQGVKKVKATNFFTTGKKFKIQHFPGNYFERKVAVKRALDKLGEPYDLIRYNCEHYAEYVQTGTPVSKQVENVVKVVGVAAAALLIIGIVNIISND